MINASKNHDSAERTVRKGDTILKENRTKQNCLALGVGAVVMASSLLWAAPLIASDYSASGELNTIFRMRPTIYEKNFYPVYEYLRLNMTNNLADGAGVSFFLGAWGRADLGDKSTSSSTDGDLQYAYLTYRAPKNNTTVTIGRQFISEGVAAERVDGLYLRSDFLYGFSASSFVGNAVVAEALPEPEYRGGTLIYGARLSQSNKKYYTVGLSALKGNRDGDSSYREEEGIDLWLRPFEQIDLTGRSTYNSITKGWMENSYALTYSPLTTLRFGADYANINFKDYLYNVTTSALSILNPIWKDNETQTAIGASVAYTGIKNLTVAGSYKFYSYDKSGDASYFGGKASYSFPDALVVGGGLYRMDGATDKLRYYEYRAFASKKIGPADLTIDAMNVNYDKSLNGVSNSYTITGTAGYEFNRKFKAGATVEYSKTPDFDREVQALVKATYTFDTQFTAAKGTTSEK